MPPAIMPTAAGPRPPIVSVPVKNPRPTGGCVCTETPALFVCMRDRASHTQRTMSQDYTSAHTIKTRGHLCFRLRSVLAGTLRVHTIQTPVTFVGGAVLMNCQSPVETVRILMLSTG